MYSLSKVLTFASLLQLIILAVKASGDVCTSRSVDNINTNNISTSQLVPLLGRNEPTFGSEQWIFPNLQFNCFRTLTKWVFKGVGHRNARCRVQLATWRRYRFSSSSLSYEQVSTTDRNTARVTVEDDGSTFTYELANLVRVQPGDFVGAEISCSTFVGSADRLNVLGLRNSGNGSVSYGRSPSGSLFFIQTSIGFQENDFLPLIQVVMDPIMEVASVTIPSVTIQPGVVEGATIALPTQGEALITTDDDDSLTTITERDDNDNLTTDHNDDRNSDNNGDDEGDQSGPNIAMIAAICGSIVALIVTVVVVCVSVILVRRRCGRCTFVKQCADDESPRSEDSVKQRASRSTKSILLEKNTAYNQIGSSNLTQDSKESRLQKDLLVSISQSAAYEEMDCDNEGYETVSIQITKENQNNVIDSEVASLTSEQRYESISWPSDSVRISMVACKAYAVMDMTSEPYAVSENRIFGVEDNRTLGTNSKAHDVIDGNSIKLSMNRAYVDHVHNNLTKAIFEKK